jgi:hypothetical protein
VISPKIELFYVYFLKVNTTFYYSELLIIKNYFLRSDYLIVSEYK